MSWPPTAEEVIDRSNHPEGGTEDWMAAVIPSAALIGSGGVSTNVDMHHKPRGGEVHGIRDTMGRMERQLVESGNCHEYARQVCQREAVKMERRLERGPKGSR